MIPKCIRSLQHVYHVYHVYLDLLPISNDVLSVELKLLDIVNLFVRH